MEIFFCSLRTALIFGPGKIIEIGSPSATMMEFRAQWSNPAPLDEWEGYAVCVPEQNLVWGKAYPEIQDGEVYVCMPYQPQPIPPGDLKIFQDRPKKITP